MEIEVKTRAAQVAAVIKRAGQSATCLPTSSSSSTGAESGAAPGENTLITLCGFPLSNYYNKVKLALLEKGVPFEEERVGTHLKDEAVLASSPLGKIPFIRTPEGSLCESQAIVEYVEARYPNPPLLPADALAAAKVRELSTFIDLHLELVTRELYKQAFFGVSVSESTQERARELLDKNIAGFKRLARFSPYVAGDTFTLADCCAYVSLPMVGTATKIIYGEDLLAGAGIDWKAYTKIIAARPSAQRVDADRKADPTMPGSAAPVALLAELLDPGTPLVQELA
jgi:glutathione S-transferase